MAKKIRFGRKISLKPAPAPEIQDPKPRTALHIVKEPLGKNRRQARRKKIFQAIIFIVMVVLTILLLYKSIGKN
jgi:hypothetical protein